MNKHNGILHGPALAVALVTPCGCGLDEVIEAVAETPTFELFSGSGDDERARAWLVPDDRNAGGGPGLLGPLVGAVDGARYRLEERHRPYLFTGDLREGIRSGSFAQLPRFDPASAEVLPDRGEEPWMVVPVDRSDGWRSFRIYDPGECSAFIPWEGSADGFALADPMVAMIVESMDEVFANSGFHQREPARVTPVLQASGHSIPLLEDVDRIRFETRYFGGDIHGCFNLILDVAVEFGFAMIPAIIESSPACGAGGMLVINDGETFDVQGTVYEAWAEVNDFCFSESDIENGVIGAIQAELPEAVRRAVADALLIDPRSLGFAAESIRSCSCDQDCNSFSPAGPAWPWGQRHRCAFPSGDPGPGAGECWIQLDPDRVNVRPEGVEIVLMDDDDDVQRPVLSDETPLGSVAEALLCSVDRPPSVEVVTTGTLATFEVE